MSYNNYANHQTWQVSLRLDNNRSSDFSWLCRAKELLEESQDSWLDGKELETTNAETAKHTLANEIKESIEEHNFFVKCKRCNHYTAFNLLESDNVYSDLLQSALQEVNWYEVAEGFVETAKEELESEE